MASTPRVPCGADSSKSLGAVFIIMYYFLPQMMRGKSRIWGEVTLSNLSLCLWVRIGCPRSNFETLLNSVKSKIVFLDFFEALCSMVLWSKSHFFQTMHRQKMVFLDFLCYGDFVTFSGLECKTFGKNRHQISVIFMTYMASSVFSRIDWVANVHISVHKPTSIRKRSVCPKHLPVDWMCWLLNLIKNMTA